MLKRLKRGYERMQLSWVWRLARNGVLQQFEQAELNLYLRASWDGRPPLQVSMQLSISIYSSLRPLGILTARRLHCQDNISSKFCKFCDYCRVDLPTSLRT